MFKRLLITAIVLYLMRSFWRLMYPRLPTRPQQIQVKACEYCGILVPEDKGIQKRGRFFCGHPHAKQFFS